MVNSLDHFKEYMPQNLERKRILEKKTDKYLHRK